MRYSQSKYVGTEGAAGLAPVTWKPDRASAYAHDMPLMPPPITATRERDPSAFTAGSTPACAPVHAREYKRALQVCVRASKGGKCARLCSRLFSNDLCDGCA